MGGLRNIGVPGKLFWGGCGFLEMGLPGFGGCVFLMAAGLLVERGGSVGDRGLAGLEMREVRILAGSVTRKHCT